MMKKLGFLLGIVSLVLSSSVFASGVSPVTTSATPYFDGLYLGIAAGVNTTKPKLSSDNNIDVWTDSTKSTSLVTILGQHDHGDYGKTGFNGTLFGGYGKTFRNFYYVGAEMSVNYFNTKMQNSYTYPIRPINPGAKYEPNGFFSVDSPWSLSGAVRLGYLLLPRAMVYALIGFDYSKFKVKNTMSNHYVDANIDKNFIITDQFNKSLPAFAPGLGADIAISNHLSMRLQYIFAFYDSYEHKIMKQGMVPSKISHDRMLPYEINMTTKLDPSRGTVQVMLSYLFN